MTSIKKLLQKQYFIVVHDIWSRIKQIFYQFFIVLQNIYIISTLEIYLYFCTVFCIFVFLYFVCACDIKKVSDGG